MTAGQSYGIRIGGYRGARGSGSLELTCFGPAGVACCRAYECSLRTPLECEAEGGIPYPASTDCATDSDGDTVADLCDDCPSDPLRAAPGPCGCNVTDMDTDGDGSPDCIDDDLDGDRVPNAEDASAVDPYRCRDADADGCDDCSSGIDDPAADGADADRDGYCMLGDCNDVDPSAWRRPGEVESLRFRSDRTTLWWDAPSDPGCTPPCALFDTLRSGLPWDFGEGATCVEWDDGGDTHANDAAVPASGQGFYYLVRAENGCGEGSLGQTSDGRARRGRHCP